MPFSALVGTTIYGLVSPSGYYNHLLDLVLLNLVLVMLLFQFLLMNMLLALSVAEFS